MNVFIRADPNVIVALVANKCDLEDKRVVSREVCFSLFLFFLIMMMITFFMG